MVKCREKVNQHLVSAKEWVSRAQKSFETEKDIRGELDLFLAQAELAHAKKANRTRWLPKYPLIKQSGAFIVAVVVVALGMGASYWFSAHLPAQSMELSAPAKNLTSNYPAVKLPGIVLGKEKPLLPARAEDALPTQGKEAAKLPNTPSKEPSLASEAARPSAARATSGAHLAPQPQSPYSKTPDLVSKEQMQTLIRSAGDSLRSRE